MSGLAEHMSESVLKRVHVRSTETPDGAVHTEVTGPLGMGLLQVRTWRMPDRKIGCEVSGPLKGMFADKVEAFLAVINRLKIIAEKDGRNVYNLYNPGMPSPAALRHLERKLRTMAEKIVFPGTCTLSVTPRCPCRCVHCSADRFVDGRRPELTTDQIKDVVGQAVDLGVSNVVFTGGEPMAREDLPDLIAHVDKNRAHAMIFTSGVLLTEKNVARLAEAGLDSLNVSIDADSAEVHDRLRRVPGAFAKAFEGARRARAAGILTGMSTYGSHESVTSGALEHLLQIARDEGFHEVTIFDCVPTGKFLGKPEVIMGRKDVKRVRALADKYNADTHPMGIVAQAKANGYDGGGCFGGFAQFYMTCYGDINPCDFNPISFGNVQEEPLEAIWRRLVSHPEYAPHRHSCRMQSARYRAQYVEPIRDEERLPVRIERLPGDGTILPESAVGAARHAVKVEAGEDEEA
ncbi:MAG: radical SAM protein [Planctomycetes bacterium]|nr:radical SAM protein [Planctomycetota bacterium]